MKRIILGVLLALALSSTFVSLPTSAHAAVPPRLKELAKQMRCKWGEEGMLSGGGNGVGWHCIVKNRLGRQEFYIMKHNNYQRALDYWRDWTASYSEDDEPGYFARKGKIIIVSQGNGVGGDWGYSYKWANYAAKKVDGKVVAGYH